MTDSTLKPSSLRPAGRAPGAWARAAIALVAVLLTVLTQWGPLAGSTSLFGNELLRDRFVRVHATLAPEPRLLVVDIDESSLAALGPWPWPRARIADLVETLLTHYSARGVALDILMPEPADAAGDARLAMLAAHGPVVLAQAFDFVATRPQPIREGTPGGATLVQGSGIVASGYIANHAGLSREARHIGSIGFMPDPDGVLRRVPLVTTYEGRHYPALALALVNCCTGSGPLVADQPGAMRIPYKRDWNAFTVVTAADILHQSIDPASAQVA